MHQTAAQLVQQHHKKHFLCATEFNRREESILAAIDHALDRIARLEADNYQLKHGRDE